MPPMNLLTIETTCDETAAAVVTDRLEVLSSVVASQDALHERFGGVVPEIASRAHVERILPVIDEALRKAGLTLADLDAVAVANTPGLAGSLLVGLDGGEDAVRCVRSAAGGGESLAGAHLRLPDGERRGCVSLRRADRQRRALESVSLRRARPISRRWAARSTTRPARRSTKSPACSGCRTPAGRRSNGPRAGGDPRTSPFPAAAARRPGAARFQLQRAEDGGAVSGRRAGKARAGRSSRDA